MTLPENPTEEIVSAYIKALIDRIPDQYRQDYTVTIRKKIATLDPQYLPIVLRQLPNDEGLVNTYIRPAINKLIRPEHLPAFTELWSRSDLLISEARRQRWEDTVRETMKERIKERREISPTVIALAAGARDPDTYEDLAWHFINSRWGHDTMLREMKHCEGLKLPSLIDQAWRRARLTLNSVNGLAFPAAALGLPDALRHAYLQLERYEGDARIAKRETLQELTTFEGPSNEFETWLKTHLSKLSFDPSVEKYQLTKKPAVH